MSNRIRVVAAVIKKEDKYLITRRAPSKHLAGFWEFPGGKIEEGETPEACLIREIDEELDITVSVRAFFMENEHIYPSKKIILIAFFCEMTAGEITLKDHDKFEWVSKEQFDHYKFAPADIPFVKALQSL
jgi:8-oxo-dGTP diphosphatase